LTAVGGVGVVSLAALDVRRRPDHRAELGSQLLLGEPVEILRSRDVEGWVQVRSRMDGYIGWVRAWGLLRCSRPALVNWVRRAGAEVTVPFVEALARPGGRESITPLGWGARVHAAGRKPGWIRIELPGGRTAWVPRGALRANASAPPGIEERIRSLLGVPYLWGGRTAMGLDCSGLTQLVLREQGISLPRDSRDQAFVSRPLARGESARQGDLIFFGRRGEQVSHVGIWLSPSTFVHCRGSVRIASLNPANPLCDKELLPQFRGIRRPPQTGSNRVFGRPRGGKSA
jgi:cell wall-associated NlpC family hydrolase